MECKNKVTTLAHFPPGTRVHARYLGGTLQGYATVSQYPTSTVRKWVDGHGYYLPVHVTFDEYERAVPEDTGQRVIYVCPFCARYECDDANPYEYVRHEPEPRGTLTLVCAWCKTGITEYEIVGESVTSHGMCAGCEAMMERQIKAVLR